MNRSSVQVLSALLMSLQIQPVGAQTSPEAMALNHEGISALKSQDYELSFAKFEAALKLDPRFDVAKGNLCVAHNNYALHLMTLHKDVQALEQLHQAAYIRSDPTTIGNMNQFLRRRIHVNPSSFAARIALAEKAKGHNDLIGAIVEYSAALKLSHDPSTQRKLAEVNRAIKHNDKDAAEETKSVHHP